MSTTKDWLPTTREGQLEMAADWVSVIGTHVGDKKRYFLTSPLTDADYISLGFKPHDNIPTPSGIPTAFVLAKFRIKNKRRCV